MSDLKPRSDGLPHAAGAWNPDRDPDDDLPFQDAPSDALTAHLRAQNLEMDRTLAEVVDVRYAPSTAAQAGEPWKPPSNERSLDIDLTEEVPWAIGPCIAPGDCAYFVGLDGEGKTTLVADILWGILAGPQHDDEEGRGTCLAGAWHINREYLPHGCRVLVLNGETAGQETWARKLAEVGLSRGIAPYGEEDRELRSRVRFHDTDEIGLRPESMKLDAVAFGKWIAAQEFDAVIIDPIFNFFDPPDNADSTWVNRGLKPLVTVLKSYGITSLCIAHPSSIAMQKGRKGGPRLQQIYTPFGSSQQKGVHDARFGVCRLDRDQQVVELLKLKDRRGTDNWIPKLDSRLRLNFASSGSGYSGVEMRGSGWEYHDPTGGVVLGEATQKMLAILPGTKTEPFSQADAIAAGIRRQNWTAARDQFFLPQGILRAETLPKAGAPIVYYWTSAGIRARETAKRNFPYEKPRKTEEKKDVSES